MTKKGVMSRGERILYDNRTRNYREWLTVMGYDVDVIDEWFSKMKIDRAEGTRKLLAYVYEGKPCTYDIKDRRNPKDISGMRFNRLLAVSPVDGGAYYRFRCDCGNVTTVRKYDVVIGHTKSCGCYLKECRNVYGFGNRNEGHVECRELMFNGVKKTISEWAHDPAVSDLGISRRSIYERLNRGWSVEKALTTPTRKTIE